MLMEIVTNSLYKIGQLTLDSARIGYKMSH